MPTPRRSAPASRSAARVFNIQLLIFAIFCSFAQFASADAVRKVCGEKDVLIKMGGRVLECARIDDVDKFFCEAHEETGVDYMARVGEDAKETATDDSDY